MPHTAYDPGSPAALDFFKRLDALTLCARNMVLNWPWQTGGDSAEELKFKAEWRKLRGLPDIPFGFSA